jgi:hypothetical protein
VASDMSEALREEKGGGQVTQQKGTHDEPDQVLGGHSRSTPLRTAMASTKNNAVRAR